MVLSPINKLIGTRRGDLENPTEDLFHEALHALQTADTMTAVERIHRTDDPVTIMKTYRDLVNHLYWKQKDLSTALALSLVGIQYGLTFRAGRGGAEITYDLRSLAKTLAYNLASFSWLGWDESGIHINSTVAAVGLDAARLNLRLAEELNKGDLPLARGHWMLGAQWLANGESLQAQQHFQESAKYAKLAESPAEVWLAFGFAALTQVLADPGNETAKRELDEILSRLNQTENGKEFAGQITTAQRVFTAH
jgi:hypothetical protein